MNYDPSFSLTKPPLFFRISSPRIPRPFAHHCDAGSRTHHPRHPCFTDDADLLLLPPVPGGTPSRCPPHRAVEPGPPRSRAASPGSTGGPGILPALGERPSGRSSASPGVATRPFPALPTPTCGARGRRLSLLWPSGTSTEATPRCLPLPHSSGQRPPTCHTLGHRTQSILGPKTSPFPRCRP